MSLHLTTWLGIALCLSQSAMFSGLNLAFFSVSRLRLEIESERGNPQAQRVLALRKDANFLLTTILWGNVSVNVLLTILSNSVLTGLMAFIFSTVIITFAGEIIPQAYFSRHALRIAHFFIPILRLYQIVLYPISKPTAFALDRWLGSESILYFQEQDLKELVKIHVRSDTTDIDRVEGTGVLNFLALDDLRVMDEGEVIHPDSVIALPFEHNRPVFPRFESDNADEFLKRIQKSGMKWVILTDTHGEAQMVIDADGFLRAVFFEQETVHPLHFCHRPIVIRDPKAPIGQVILRLKVHPQRSDDDVIDQDIILLWSDTIHKILTGSDILGRLLRGIVKTETIRPSTLRTMG